MMLAVDGVSAYYGKIRALWDVSINVEKGEIVALIGANAAGKTTILDTISGLLHPASGSVKFLDRRIDHLPPHEIVKIGMCHIPEGGKAFPDMTVRENLDMGAYRRRDVGVQEDLERVFDLFPRLKERERQKAGTMSGGEQQMLAIGRALMARPKLLMLDEPSMGIAPILVERIYETIAEINRQGVAILLVEQNANYALDVSKRGYVLETGEVALTNESAELRNDPAVQRAYLGT